MTADQFRSLALSFPGVEEKAHQSHPDFRVRNKIFATLGYPDELHGMVKLTPKQQAEVMAAAPGAFYPAAGAWGRNGSTVVLLSQVIPRELEPILRQACEAVR
ncbi:MAG TPA: MmcQ/YjbR family DNA-binding protein [Chthoniobacterales bacterium]|jgi:hypothetical protein